jgi:1,4-dihydroxy-2-naphthoate octaprenyltransferase
MSIVGLWWQAVRPFAFTVSLIPPILGGVTALIDNSGLDLNVFRLVLTGLGCMTAHAGANLLSDYYDYKARVDREGTFGSSGLLVAKAMKPSQVLGAGCIAMIIAGLIGAYLVYVTPGGSFLIWLILIGGIFGVFYTAGPIEFKYRAFGDIAVFVSFGPAMVLGAYYVQAHRFSWLPVLYSIPIGLLTDAILHSNNLRDIANDKVVNIKTVPILIGETRAKSMYYGLVFGAYATTVALILFAGLTLFSLIVFLSFPLALRATKMVRHKDDLPVGQFAMIDAATAQIHLALGLLTVISLVVQYLIVGSISNA